MIILFIRTILHCRTVRFSIIWYGLISSLFKFGDRFQQILEGFLTLGCSCDLLHDPEFSLGCCLDPEWPFLCVRFLVSVPCSRSGCQTNSATWAKSCSPRHSRGGLGNTGAGGHGLCATVLPQLRWEELPMSAISHRMVEWPVDLHDFKQVSKNKIDFVEVVILDTHTSCQIGQTYERGKYETVLRVFVSRCNFAQVRRVLLPMNVTHSDHVGMTIADAGEGTHFLLGELLLTTNKSAPVRLTWRDQVPNYYQDITGEDITGEELTWQERSCNVLVIVGDLVSSSLPILKNLSEDMVISKTTFIVSLHTNNAQWNGIDCVLWVLSVVYTRALWVCDPQATKVTQWTSSTSSGVLLCWVLKTSWSNTSWLKHFVNCADTSVFVISGVGGRDRGEKDRELERVG